MKSDASTPADYLAQLPPDRREAVSKLRDTIKKNLPKGFEEVMSYGMLGYVVPHSLYKPGYHCNPNDPLPFMCLASQKNSINLYHMGIYALPKLLHWFQEEYAAHVPTKLDMGKSCIRFKKPEHIPHALIAELVKRMTPQEWIDVYESTFKR